jgi:hypothetical protein
MLIESDFILVTVVTRSPHPDLKGGVGRGDVDKILLNVSDK